jgi:hypothetical protein
VQNRVCVCIFLYVCLATLLGLDVRRTPGFYLGGCGCATESRVLFAYYSVCVVGCITFYAM